MDEGPKGHAIKDELEAYYEKEINHGRLYPNLYTLSDRGFIEKGTIDKRTSSYTLTQKGKQEIQDREDWESPHLDTNAIRT